MSTNAIFVGWNRPVPGREQMSGELFQELMQYMAGLQQEGAIESFETVLLSPHGGDLNGFILVRGENGKLNDLQASEAWQGKMTRGGIHIEGLGAVRGATGELVMEWMQRWTASIPT